ncbi:MAG: hypothetical protein ACK53L_36265, partial [Pirellulaceae bacterium]
MPPRATAGGCWSWLEVEGRKGATRALLSKRVRPGTTRASARSGGAPEMRVFDSQGDGVARMPSQCSS